MMMAIWYLAGILVILLAVYRISLVYLRWRTHIQHIVKLPGTKWHPLLGALAEFPGPSEAGFEFIRSYTPYFPRISYSFYGPFNVTVAVMHPATMKIILKTSEPKPLEFGGYFAALPWLGRGLLLSGGKKWARNRRLLTPAFHFDILKPYILVNNRAADTLLIKLAALGESGEYFEVFSLVSLCTLEVILKCAFSFDEEIQLQGDNNPYVKTVHTLSTTLVYRSLRPWLYPPWIFYLTRTGREFKRCCDLAHSMADDVIQRRKTAMKTNASLPQKPKKILDFLDILLTARDEDDKGLTDKEIRAEVDTFLFEGHDTTASGISWTLYTLAQHPEWRAKCQEELDDIFQGRETEDLLWDDLPKLETLTMCIKETLRLHTPVPIIERQTTKDMYIDGYFIPAGTVIDIHLYAMMHNNLVWKDPEKFMPERFLKDGDTKAESFAFLPFSAGPRNCIGQNFAMHEMKVLIGRILRRFSLDVDPQRPVRQEFRVVMRTEDGMFMKVTPRK